jgi:hypothetical protein
VCSAAKHCWQSGSVKQTYSSKGHALTNIPYLAVARAFVNENMVKVSVVRMIECGVKITKNNKKTPI